MWRKSRWLWWMLAVSMLVLGLAACQRATPTPTQEAAQAEAAQPTKAAEPTKAPAEAAQPTESQPESPLGIKPEDLKGVKVVFWHVWSRKVGDGLQRLVDEFNQTNEWGIQVEAVNQGGYGQMFNKMNAAINAGELPNIVVGYQNQMQAWDMAGEVMVDLTPYVNDPVYGLSQEEQQDFFKVFWDQDVIGGKRYGIPVMRSAQYMFYNVSWAKELGFDNPPATPDDFYAQACAAYQANLNDDDPNNDGTGGWVVSSNASVVVGWIWAFGGDIVDQEGKYTFDTPEAEQALRFLKKLYDDGCAWQTESRYPNPEFATRQALFTSSSVAGIPYQIAAFKDAGTDDDWTLIPFPSAIDKPVLNVYGPSFAVVKGTPEQQLASWLFIKWFVTPENQAKWIRVSGYFPTRKSTEQQIQDYMNENPQWAAAFTAFKNEDTLKKFEPRDASWSAVRQAVGEYVSQIFQADFSADQIPDLLKELQQTAEELYAEQHSQ